MPGIHVQFDETLGPLAPPISTHYSAISFDDVQSLDIDDIVASLQRSLNNTFHSRDSHQHGHRIRCIFLVWVRGDGNECPTTRFWYDLEQLSKDEATRDRDQSELLACLEAMQSRGWKDYLRVHFSCKQRSLRGFA